MKDESYPPSNLSHLAQRLQSSEVSGVDCDWTGNDESGRHNHNKVSLNSSPMRLRLSWKRSPDDHVHLIGVFDLDLRKLLADGYVRVEPKTEDKEIRLRFYHDADGVIYIQTKMGEPKLPVGRMP